MSSNDGPPVLSFYLYSSTPSPPVLQQDWCNRATTVQPFTGCVNGTGVCGCGNMCLCVCYSVFECSLARVITVGEEGAHPTSSLRVKATLWGRTTDWVAASCQGVNTTKSKSFFTPALLITFPMVLGKFSPHLTQQGGGREMSFTGMKG